MIKNFLRKVSKKDDQSTPNDVWIMSERYPPLFAGRMIFTDRSTLTTIVNGGEKIFCWVNIFNYPDGRKTRKEYTGELKGIGDIRDKILGQMDLLKKDDPTAKSELYDLTKYKTYKEKIEAYNKLGFIRVVGSANISEFSRP